MSGRVAVLLGLLALVAACGGDAGPPRTVVLEVEGMVCDGCVETVTKALEAVEGVRACTVDLEEGRATCTVDAAVDPATLVAAVGDHYKATVASPAPANGGS